MIKFIFKAILRDKNRSLLPVIITSTGVFLTIVMSGYLRGVMGDIIDQNARFETGHIKIMSKAYAENKNQIPNDLALLGVTELIDSLENDYPEYDWVKRIRFGGIIDVPDENGETKGQGPTAGMAVELFSKESGEVDRLNMKTALVEGRLPNKPGEAIIGHELSNKLEIKTGDEVTYMGTTMYGSMTFQSLKVTGTIRFGVSSLDKGGIIIDISDAQTMLNMENGAGEILGYAREGVYFDDKAKQTTDDFNKRYADPDDEFAPVMFSLKEQNNLAGYIDYVDSFSSMFIVIFVIVMSIVLWNTGLIGGLRRYQEFGIRLALGEEKRHIYNTLIYEALFIGFLGSLLGTIFGLGATWYLQVYGIDISGMISGGTMLMPSVFRAKFTPDLLYIGFIPGLFAMVMGNMLSGMGIYKRETAHLFKELEV